MAETRRSHKADARLRAVLLQVVAFDGLQVDPNVLVLAAENSNHIRGHTLQVVLNFGARCKLNQSLPPRLLS